MRSLLIAASCSGIVAIQAACSMGFVLPPTVQMLLLTYFTLFIACHASTSSAAAKDRDPSMSAKDAAQLPLIAGVALVGLYLCFKYLDAAWVNIVLRVYFCAAGVGAVALGVRPACLFLSPRSGDRALFTFPAVPYLSPTPQPVTPADVFALCVGTAFSAWYGVTGSWQSNNALGFAFAIGGIALMNLGSVPVGALLLGGLFFYDIFMVFGTGALLGPHKASIMEEVAVRVDGPIKLMFPLSPLDALGKARPFSMLGLGDILVPGIFLALLLRFDIASFNKSKSMAAAATAAAASGIGKGKGAAAAVAAAAAVEAVESSEPPTPYFNAAMFAYSLGLMATTIAMHTFDAAQPALLYLVPAVLGVTAALAISRGEVVALWAYSEEEVAVKEGGVAKVGEEAVKEGEAVKEAGEAGGRKHKEELRRRL